MNWIERLLIDYYTDMKNYPHSTRTITKKIALEHSKITTALYADLIASTYRKGGINHQPKKERKAKSTQ